MLGHPMAEIVTPCNVGLTLQSYFMLNLSPRHTIEAKMTGKPRSSVNYQKYDNIIRPGGLVGKDSFIQSFST